ncbi:Inositol-pentakisphosphate 2-kinase [Myotisia sp. PD_48]|nr:Inositol-pentakisphosphate 2-kinase [Myotisia sp. PD_48]
MAPMQTYEDTGIPVTASLMHHIGQLPHHAQLTYLAEGGANIVYRISIRANAAPQTENEATEITGASSVDALNNPSMYAGKLLRLRKKIDSGMPYIETARKFDSEIRNMFRDDELVGQELVRLPKNFVAACNVQLRTDEINDLRPELRRGVYLSTKEPFGLLITDMTTAPGSSSTLWEFKPKWLLQSPSAPPDAKRCRTCAFRDMKNDDNEKAAAKAGTKSKRKKSFCPLDLVSDDFESVLRAVKLINNSPSARRVASLLHRNPTLLKLRDRQLKMNFVGLPGLRAQDRDKGLSMTLRDCTMYVKVPQDPTESLEIRLGDLDLKTGGGGKLAYWKDTETRLIQEGWYSGTQKSQEAKDCALDPDRTKDGPSGMNGSSGSSHSHA